MLLQAVYPTTNVLLQKYYSDSSRNTLEFFKQRDIGLVDLQYWQQRYPVVFPWDSIYNTLRLGYNNLGQFFPLMIVMCSSKREIVWALQRALQLNVKFAIRSGGHDSNNYSLSTGIIIDLSSRDFVIPDLQKETAKVGAGARNGQLVEALSPLGYVLPTGTCQNVAVAGLTLGGGIGFLERKYGLTFDSLLSVTMILASGEIITASSEENPDLFWACKGGGGGSLGIVTDFTFKIHPLKKVTLFNVTFGIDKLDQVVDRWQRWAPYTDPNLTTELNLYSPRKTDQCVRVTGQYAGVKEDLYKLLVVFQDLCPEQKIWTASTKEAAEYYATPFPAYFGFFRNLFSVEFLSKELIRLLYVFMEKAPRELSLEMNALRGQIKTLSCENTAFPWRKSLFWTLIKANTNVQSDVPCLAEKVRELYNIFLENGQRNEETGLPRSYVNFKDPDFTKDQYPLAYWGQNAEQLSQIKSKYDPRNVFRFAQSIPLV